ncbi:hypothetical protein, partial [Nitrosococcus oceani]|uniref:hypothetical protein n=1 Tax=Nitrosococcus oceani TaxID=1229 RepID=UPI001C9A0B8E
PRLFYRQFCPPQTSLYAALAIDAPLRFARSLGGVVVHPCIPSCHSLLQLGLSSVAGCSLDQAELSFFEKQQI